MILANRLTESSLKVDARLCDINISATVAWVIEIIKRRWNCIKEMIMIWFFWWYRYMMNWAYLKLTLSSTTCIIAPVTKVKFTFITVITLVRLTSRVVVPASVATSTYAPTFIRLTFRFWNKFRIIIFQF